MAFNFNNVYFSYFVISWTNFELVNYHLFYHSKGTANPLPEGFDIWKEAPLKSFSNSVSFTYLYVHSMKCTTINTSSKLVDICSRGNRIRKVLDSEVAIYLFQIFKCFCCWHASLLPKRWEGSKTHHTLLMTLYGGLCNRAHSKFVY